MPDFPPEAWPEKWPEQLPAATPAVQSVAGCRFCEILAGQADAYWIYRDDRCVAFLDHRPIRPGHLLVIPRHHIDHVDELPDDLAAHLMVVSKHLAARIRQRLRPERVGLMVSGYGVPHMHVHVIPMHSNNDLMTQHEVMMRNGEIVFGTDQWPLAEAEQQQAMQQLLQGGA